MSWLWLLAAARAADPLPREVLALEHEVATLAAQVEAARAAGAPRGQLAKLMSAYRERAEALQAAEAPLLADRLDAAAARRAEATRRLADAVAREAADPDARAVLVEALGPPEARLDALQRIVAAGSPDPEVAAAIALDVADQAALLALVFDHDAGAARAAAHRARTRADAIAARARAGETPTVQDLAEQERLRRDAAAQDDAAQQAAAQAERARALRDRAQGGG
ncbi:MAG: hypothetical protein R3F59_20790 [Myxococcota bacterium]